MIRAKLSLPVATYEISRSLLKSVEPDNRIPQLSVTGQAKPKSLELDLELDGSVETFISTLDDLLRCLKVAMETLDTIR